MKKLDKTGVKLFLIGLGLFSSGMFLSTTSLPEPLWEPMGGLGLVLTLIGLIVVIHASKNRKAIFRIILGLILAVVGVALSVNLIQNNVDGAASFDGIPIPLTIIPAISGIVILFLLMDSIDKRE